MGSGDRGDSTHSQLVETLPDLRAIAGDPLLEDGARFDVRYEPRDLLGTGGMGEVRLCRDRRVGRDVALKTARRDPASEGDAEGRFLREARVQGQLEHPSVVPVYDLGRDASGAPFFTMKRVRGETLEDILARLAEGGAPALRQYSRRKILTAFSSVCLAVDFAHARGVVHRDLKPGNIMLGDFGEVYVLDWGIAKLLGTVEQPAGPATASGAPSTPSPATETGQTLGTPGYMSPEQAEGGAVDGRADVYALGAMLFEILALKPLHDGASPAKLLASTLRGADARPSSRAPDREIPPELDAICVKATARNPRDRFPSARDVSAAIEGYLDGDRDLTQRRKASAELAREAAVHAAAALGPEPDALERRSLAMREVSRALAFDPENAEARAILFRLLTEPPRELPPPALETMHRLARKQQAATMRGNAVAFLLCPLFLLPLFLWLGIRNWPIFVGMFGSWVLASLASWRVARRPDPRGESSLLQIVAVATAMAGATMIIGPYVVVPTVAVFAAIGISLSNASPRHRVWSAAIILAGLLGPIFAELLGLLPPSTRFDGHVVTLIPRAVAFPATATPVLLVIANVMLVLAASIIFTRLRTELTSAERRLTLTGWQLEQLVPHDVPAP